MCHWVAGAQPKHTVIMSLHCHNLDVALIWDAVRGCCITIIWLLLNSHMQVGVFCPHQVVGVISQCGAARLLHTIIWLLQLRVVALPLFGVVQTLCTSWIFCLPLGPRGLPGLWGSQGSPGGRGPGFHGFLFTVTNTVTVTNVITITGTMPFLL